MVMNQLTKNRVRITVVGVGGGGGNTLSRIVDCGNDDMDLLALNTDLQALNMVHGAQTFAIGPETTNGMGSGGEADVGRKAVRESQEKVSGILEGSDVVFITAGMGGGTGTGGAPVVADIARKQGALTVAVVTTPFSFEGHLRTEVASKGLRQLESKVDTMICVDNDRLLSNIDSSSNLDDAFQLADDVLRQGVEGISKIVTGIGVINVDFADVKTIMSNGGRSFMAIGTGKGNSAAIDSVQDALENPMFDAPIKGASGILLNIKGGKNLKINEVEAITQMISDASGSDPQVMFGLTKDNSRQWRKKVEVTVVATGVQGVNELNSEASNVGQKVFCPVPKPMPNFSNNRIPASSLLGSHFHKGS
tara:strand:- start:2405 stop:3496 length:1092 start_codon:yes stop_codon:yes gene_type:complete